MAVNGEFLDRLGTVKCEKHAPIVCDNCGLPLASVAKGGRTKVFIRSRCLVIREDGGFEIRCHHCKESTNLPFVVEKS